MAELPNDFPARVRAARGYAGVSSQRDFGKLIDYSGTTVKNWESGQHKPNEPSAPEVVKRLAQASGLPEWFFTVPRLSRSLAPPGSAVEEQLADIKDGLEALRVETEARDLEVIRRLDEGLGPGAASQ